ncbi:hypothetical protein F4861DRAFT_511848 [Xylaria intraflava]|nr:hypothetical protein F4861DRAFT_511848 [Xylaria intraflava]
MAAVPFKVKAVYEYTSGHEDDLPFPVGQIITVTDEEDTEWYGGEYVDNAGVKHEGIFPRNFVEKFEPTAPPRPARTRKREQEPPVTAALPPPPPPVIEAPEQRADESNHAQTPAEETHEETHEEIPIVTSQAPPVDQSPPAELPSVPVASPSQIVPVSVPVPMVPKDTGSPSSRIDPPQPKSPPPIQSRSTSPIQPRSPPPVQPRSISPVQPRSPPPVQSRSPPPVSQKPSSNSFRDRIAAFNKPAAPPIAPFKPSGLGSGSSGFIKKPFVAPPPSRHAYVPPPRDVPVTKIYRRDEDPEMKEAQTESIENTEKARVIPDVSSEGQDENQPKPTTLKERIALLQKQQAEAAQRHTDAATKKEKPKPPKKRVLSGDVQESPVTDQPTEMASPLDRKDSIDVNSKNSMDEPQSARQSLNISHKSVDHVENDGSGADVTGAGDTLEGQEDPVAVERDGSDERPKPASHEGMAAEGQISQQEKEEDEEEAEEEFDPEVRRKEELRARMAKMSGGMGMAGMFGPPGMMGLGGAPVKKPKPPIPVARRPSVMSERPSSPRSTAAPIPTIMALPGMGKQVQQPEAVPEPESKQEPGEEETTPVSIDDGADLEPEPTSQTIVAPPPIPEGRPAPPPIPTDSRPPPPPPPPQQQQQPSAGVAAQSLGSESDDELSENTAKLHVAPNAEMSPTNPAPPLIPMASPAVPTSPQFSSDKRGSYVGEEMSPVSAGFSPSQSKRNSRPPPPIPGVAPPVPTQPRPPPPLPPNTMFNRPSTTDEPTETPAKPGPLDSGEEVTEYEGDYDTDIASAAPHKDALGIHTTEPSLDDSSSMLTEQPSTAPPPIPSSLAPKAGPPPIPAQFNPTFRTSGDIPRAAPPPIPGQLTPRSGISVDFPRAAPPPPPPKPNLYTYEDEDYDPYNYNTAQATAPSHSTPMYEQVEDYPPYQAPPPPPPPSSSTDRRARPSTPTSSRAPPRKSLDVLRPAVAKRSLDVARHSISMEAGFMAGELDLASHTQWWLSRHGLPPALQGRKDIYTEFNESKSTEDGRKLVTKTVSVLFQDYSQTVITVQFDPKDPSRTTLDQQHEPPPRQLRQDELEEAYERFGRRLAHSVASKKDAIVGDGTPYALVHELLRPLKDALLPVGTRAYGALVYANLANASTQLNDEIRPGDIISIRNAKFQGKHGPMHAKYTVEIGKPDHVAIVAEWDGTKKKVRAWEQGRDNRKVKQESYKLEDLRSGEVKIWRVMPRTWVGWSPKD